MSHILVTGATGFLGTHLVRALLKKAGAQAPRLRILARRDSVGCGDGDIKVVTGDIRDATAVYDAMKDVSHVYHVAGLVSRNPADGPLMYRTHIDGTRNICEAAAALGTRKIVIVSSSGTVAVSREPTVHTEQSVYAYEIVGRWPYYLSKIFQEKLALSYHRTQGLPLVLVNPTLFLGPDNPKRHPGDDVALFLRRKIFGIPCGGLNFVDVRDAASALIAAMEHGRPGERYLIGGPNQTFAEFFAHLERLSHVRGPRFRLNVTTSTMAARLVRTWEHLRRTPSSLSPASIDMSTCFWYVDTTKARDELGFLPRSAEETLWDTIEDVRRTLL